MKREAIWAQEFRDVIKNSDMKVIAIIFVYLFAFGIDTHAQNSQRILGIGDSTLGSFLNTKIEKKPNLLRDSCVEGFYAIAFSLSKRGTIVKFTTSKNLPKKYRDTLK